MKNQDLKEQIVRRMQVPGSPNLYVVGCFERRVTVYTQQVRALNLVYAIANRLPKNRKPAVAVLGAGAANVSTAAAAAALLDCRVTVLERLARPLDMIGPCRHRWLHPHIYDWPADGSEADDAGLPLLNWGQDLAFRVVDRLRSEWDDWVRTLNIDVRCGVSAVGVHPLEEDRYLVTWNGKQPVKGDAQAWGNRPDLRMHARVFDVVMLTTGFGVETKSEEFPDTEVHSYWNNDNFDEEDRTRVNPDRKVLISGTGDGGLIDALGSRSETSATKRCFVIFARTGSPDPTTRKSATKSTRSRRKPTASPRSVNSIRRFSPTATMIWPTGWSSAKVYRSGKMSPSH